MRDTIPKILSLLEWGRILEGFKGKGVSGGREGVKLEKGVDGKVYITLGAGRWRYALSPKPEKPRYVNASLSVPDSIPASEGGSPNHIIWRDLKGKKFFIFSPSTGKVFEGSKALYSRHGSFAAAVVCSGRCVLMLYDRLWGKETVLQIPDRGWGKLVCGKGLCVLEGEEEVLAANMTNIYEIVPGLTPLASCGGRDYFLDRRNMFVVKTSRKSVDPLVPATPVSYDCIQETSLCISDGEKISLIEGASLLTIWDGRDHAPETLSCGSSFASVALEKDGSWILIDSTTKDYGVVKAEECLTDSEGYTYCLTSSGLIVVSASELHIPEIRVIKDKVSWRGYASIKISPWWLGSKVTVSPEVTIVEKVLEKDSVTLFLRPRHLGWRGDVFLKVSTPIYSFTGSFALASEIPSLERYLINACRHGEGGVSSDGRSDTEIDITLKLRVTTPETPDILISSPSLTYVKLEGVRRVRGRVEYRNLLRLSLRSKSLEELEVLAKYGPRETYRLGLITIAKEKCIRVREPESTLHIFAPEPGAVLAESTYQGSRLTIVCRERIFSGLAKVAASPCIPPALVVEEKERQGFRWVKEILVRHPPSIEMGGLSGTDIPDAHLDPTTYRILLRSPSYVKQPSISITGFEASSEGKVRVRVVISKEHPSITYVGCGNVLTRSEGVEAVLECDLLDLINGIYWFMVPYSKLAELPEVNILGGDSVLREALIYGALKAHTLLNHLGVEEDD